MEYFSNPYQISILKNHILKDPLIDWFNIQEYIHKECLLERDEKSYYKEFIIKESSRYKDELFQKINMKLGLDVSFNPSIKETLTMIKKKSPLIFNGKLLYDGNMIVKCDIILREDYFRKIFSKIGNIPFHIYVKEKQYMLINFSYASIHFKLDLKETYSEGLLMYKKCCLYAFQTTILKLLNYKPQCFLLGKEYYYKKTLLPKKEFIGYVLIDEKLKFKFENAFDWIQKLRKDYFMMNIDPKPTCIELYPNMNNKESDWEKEKYKLANRIKEITLVWNITYEERCEYLRKNIECWDDSKLLFYLKESKKKDIQERMIHMNKHNDILIYPRKTVSSTLNEVLQREYNIYFDIESFLSFDEKQNLIKTMDDPIIAIIGIIFNHKYYNYTIEKFNLEEETKIIHRFADDLIKISKGNPLNIFHWGHAENNYMKYIYKKYPDIKFPQMNLINILDYFRTEPIIVQGVFKFGLKSIGRALYKNKLIETTWNETDNGLDSMIQFKDVCIKNKKKIPIKRYKEIKDIVEYNRIDCKVLEEIVELLREIYV